MSIEAIVYSQESHNLEQYFCHG